MNPIDSFDLEDLVIQKEILTPVEQSNIVNNSTISIDNRGNISQEPVITITLNNSFTTGFTITNSANNVSVVIPAPSTNYASGKIFKIFYDSAYYDDIEIAAAFSAPFIILEDCINTFTFALSGSDSFNASVSWLHPSPTEIIKSYITNFQYHEARTKSQLGTNPITKISNGSITTAINGDFSIDSMLVDTWFEDENDYTYRLKWQTDSEIGDINQQLYFFCGCQFNDMSWGRQDENIVTENVKGVYRKRIKG